VKRWYPSAAVLAVALVLPWIFRAPYYQHILITILIWAVMGTAWNLLGGYAGQVSFGHAAFFGLGAYTAGILAAHFNISPWWGMLLGPLVASLISVPVGLICFRLRGPYFALAMLALGEIFRLVFINWVSLTSGARGIMIIPRITAKIPYYYMALLLLLIALVTVDLLIKSKCGFYFVSIREDQDAAESLGVPTTRYKLYALLASAFLTGLAGAFYMNYIAFIDPNVVFSLTNVSVMIILVVMLGGVATRWGPTVGAAIYIVLSELFRTSLGSASVLAFGVLVCLVIMFLPNGLVGELEMVKKAIQARTNGSEKSGLLRG